MDLACKFVGKGVLSKTMYCFEGTFEVGDGIGIGWVPFNVGKAASVEVKWVSSSGSLTS